MVTFDDVRAINETDAAVLVEVEGQEVWFPKSHIGKDSEVKELGDTGTIEVTEWIAEQKGLV
jgi:hypothetical protein